MFQTMYCSSCSCELHESNYYEVEGDLFCKECYDSDTFKCECCGERFLYEKNYGDDDTMLCRSCFNEEYHRCNCCGRIIHDDDTYWASDYPYCSNCYEEDDSDEDREYDNIHEYSYKPAPIFRRCTNEDAKRIRYYGVELEIDEGGKDDENAEDILYEANGDSDDEDMLYIKTDGSLNDGMELVSHPCSILYHRTEFPWKDITRKAKSLGYTSHNAGTCGLHVHISRDRLGESSEDQEETISRLMFFFESHWNELVKFSRRTEHALNQWAARYGYKDCPKEILENAKSSSKGRYASVNICNAKTVEIRMFRGTLKYNTLIATLEMVDAICENVICHTDDELHGQSWADFVVSINPEYIELIRYLKERQLYVNEPVAEEEEV